MTGVAVFPTLTTTNSSTVTVDGGKQDAVRTTVASRVSRQTWLTMPFTMPYTKTQMTSLAVN